MRNRELVEEYLRGARGRFLKDEERQERKIPEYSLSHPAAMWNGAQHDEALSKSGGRQRPGKQDSKKNVE